MSYKNVLQQEQVTVSEKSPVRQIMRVEHPSQIYALLESVKPPKRVVFPPEDAAPETLEAWKVAEQSVYETIDRAKECFSEFGLLDCVRSPGMRRNLAHALLQSALIESPYSTHTSAAHVAITSMASIVNNVDEALAE